MTTVKEFRAAQRKVAPPNSAPEDVRIRPAAADILAAIMLVCTPFYAFLTVWGSTLVGHFTLLRLWDDALLAILLVTTAVWVVRDAVLRRYLFNHTLVRLLAAYVVLALFAGCVSYIRHDVTAKAAAYGMLVDTRFFIWLAAAWVIASRSPWLKRSWQPLVFWPLALVTVFALFQFFILPHDFLAHFGYDIRTTYVPFITINQDSDTIRAQSFLRGANPLGAYLVLGASLLAVCILSARRRVWHGVLAVCAAGALVVSFSRSAWIGTVAAIGTAAWLSLRRTQARKLFFAGLCALIVIGAAGIALLHRNHGIQDAFFHVSTDSTAAQTSNAGHASAFRDSVHDIVHEPLGRGPGTAGQASWYNAPHPIRNSESYFLQVGQELGWLGLILLVAVLWYTARALNRRRGDMLARGLLAAFVGLLVVNALTYGWIDDTLGFLYWGLVGIALGSKRPSSDS